MKSYHMKSLKLAFNDRTAKEPFSFVLRKRKENCSMSNEQVKSSCPDEQVLSAWKYYVQRFVSVYTKNNMLRVGKNSWWSRIKEDIPDGFADEYGRIREPWLTAIASWLHKYGLRISENLDIPVDNIIPSAISVNLSASCQTATP